MVKDSVASLKMFSDEEETPPLDSDFVPSSKDPLYVPGYVICLIKELFSC
jgi:hypothetical protein